MTAVMDHPEQRPTEPPLRPAWTLTADQTLSELDDLQTALTRLTARRLELLHHFDDLGHAKALGARDTVELLSLRHRLDPQQVRRDLKTAHALRNHPVVAAQLPGYPTPVTDATHHLSPMATTDPTDPGQGASPDDPPDARETADGCASDRSKVADACEVADATDPLTAFVDRRRMALAREVSLNPAQTAVIAEVLAGVPAYVPAADVAVAETELVIAARTLLPGDLRRLGRAVVDRLDTDGPPPAGAKTQTDDATDADANVDANTDASIDAAEAAHAAETLWWQPATVPDPLWASRPAGMPKRVQGLRFGGFMTGENAELFQTLIDAAAKPRKTPSGELDPRTLGQRRADAFAIVLRAAAASGGEIPVHGGIKPHLSVTIPYTDLTTSSPKDPTPDSTPDSTPGPTPDSTPGPMPGPTPGPTPGPMPAPTNGLTNSPTNGLTPRLTLGPTTSTAIGSLVFGPPLSIGDVRRIACDAGVIPIVLGSQGEPLDVGREYRFVTPAIRRALIARDGGCVISGCGAPPGHCIAHHVIHWADGGITAVSNLVLVCPTHHRAIHRGTWIVAVVDGTVRITRPDWTEPGPSG